jgi:hypothetical protein
MMTPLRSPILRRIRIYPQLLIGALMSSVTIASMLVRFTMTDMVILPFALLAMFGGIFALMGFKAGNWMLLCPSLALLVLGCLFHYVRIRFMIENGGMEGPGGYGSPVAFLLGWIMTTIIFFVPGLVWTVWNLHAIKHNG